MKLEEKNYVFSKIKVYIMSYFSINAFYRQFHVVIKLFSRIRLKGGKLRHCGEAEKPSPRP